MKNYILVAFNTGLTDRKFIESISDSQFDTFAELNSYLERNFKDSFSIIKPNDFCELWNDSDSDSTDPILEEVGCTWLGFFSIKQSEQ